MSDPSQATLADVGEFGLIRALADLFPQGDQVLLGPGDDAAVLACPDGRVLVSTDLHVDTRHFRRDWATAEQIGHKIAAANLSDINAMGGAATALTVGLAAPADLPTAWALDLARGIADECALVGASVVGGDLTAADQVVVAVTAPRRGGGRPGAPLGGARRRRARPRRPAGLGRCRALRPGPRLPLAPGARRGLQAPRAALRRRRPGASGRRHRDDRRLGRAAGRCGAHRGSQRCRRRHRDRLLRDRRAAAGRRRCPWGPIRCSSSSAAGTTTRWSPRSPPTWSLPDGWTRIGTVAEGEGVTVDAAAYDGPTGHRHF